jgi:uncharacterized lipoprotein NlpE involved in copper resistance
MKKRIFIVGLILIIFSLVGCSEQIEIESEKSLVLQKLINENQGEYEPFKEIKDKEKVETVINILRKAKWKESSDKSTYPDYKMNNNYSIWVLSPNNNIRVRAESINKDAFLSDKDSKTIYEIMINAN